MAGCLAVYVLHARRYGRWLIDDAMISFAYARTISAGGGPAQQLGAAPVEGFSNPTWTLLLAGLTRLGVFLGGNVWFGVPDYVVVPRVLAGLCFLGILWAGYLALRSFLPPAPANLGLLVAGLALATSPGYVIWSVSGLENPLYGLLVAVLAAVIGLAIASSALLHPQVAVLCSLLALLAALTRPDGAIFAAAYPLAALLTLTRGRWWASLRAVLVAVLTFVVPAAGLLLARHAEFGQWLPNTAVAKAQSGLSIQSVLRLGDLLNAATPAGAIGGTVLVSAALTVAVRRWRRRTRETRPDAAHNFWPAGLGMLVTFVLGVAAFGVLKKDWMGMWRFATPAIVTGSWLLGAATAVLVIELRRRAAQLVVVVASLAVVGTSLVLHEPRVREFLADPSAPGCYVVNRYGRTFNFYADRLGISHGSVLAPDLGGLLLTSRLEVVDLAGLTDTRIGRLRGQHNVHGIADYVFDELHPTFIHTHVPWNRGITSDPRLRQQYVSLLGHQDWVRRDAVPAGFDVKRLRLKARGLLNGWDEHRLQDPLVSCGRLSVGQLPQT